MPSRTSPSRAASCALARAPRRPASPALLGAAAVLVASLVASLAASLAVSLVAPAVLPAHALHAQGVDLPPGRFAFVDVTVLPMTGDGERLPHRTVLVEGERITAVGPVDAVAVPEGFTVIEGAGRFLMPGLAEMHAHVPPVAEGRPPREALEEIMFLYVANGITTIRGMLGSPYQLELRGELARHEMLGPAFHPAAPSLNGTSAPTPDAAEALLRAAARDGYDLMKIHPGVSRESWDRMVRVAREVGLSFGGHVPADVGLEHALETGISTVDHMDGYLEAAVTPAAAARARARGEPLGMDEVLQNLDEGRMRALARRTREVGAYVVPTHYLWANRFTRPDPDSVLALPEMGYVSPRQREAWRRQAQGGPRLTPENRGRFVEARDRMLNLLAEEGALLLMGTDSPQLYNVPGFALHRELAAMEAAGLDRRTILRSGTRNVGRYVEEVLGMDGSFGTVAPGQRADLVLLDADPLEDLDHLTRRGGVMVRGRWLDRAFLEAGLRAIAARHRPVG
ncbi:MAG: amidohydrolase family protein [Longimicrobiales bacterium]|nr:amidohydrolase family protein [Longimicrobiales bacterium]